jgi:ankyrin repeat protein
MGKVMGGTDLPPLHAAARDGDLHAVRSLLKRFEVMTRDSWGETPLHWASTGKVAECLIAAGAAVNIVDPTGDTPLHWAVENANLEVSQLLIEHGAEVNHANRRGDTPLHAAASSADWGILRMVLDKGADAKKINVAGESAMHVACRAGDVNLSKALVKAGARVKASCHEGTTALHEACAHGSLALVKYLLQRGADHNALTKSGRSPLQNALKRKAVPLVDELVEKGADVGCLAAEAAARGYGWTAMHLGAELGSLKLLQAIVKKGPSFYDAEAKNEAGQTPSDVARASAFVTGDKVVKFLDEQIKLKKLAAGGNVDKRVERSKRGDKSVAEASGRRSSNQSSAAGSKAGSTTTSRNASRQNSTLNSRMTSAAGSATGSHAPSAVTSQATSAAGSAAGSVAASRDASRAPSAQVHCCAAAHVYVQASLHRNFLHFVCAARRSKSSKGFRARVHTHSLSHTHTYIHTHRPHARAVWREVLPPRGTRRELAAPQVRERKRGGEESQTDRERREGGGEGSKRQRDIGNGYLDTMCEILSQH